MNTENEIQRRLRTKMNFLMNALEDGWTIKKREDKYILTKKHENRREVWQESYLENFIVQMSTTVVNN
jgi:hypothetical protein